MSKRTNHDAAFNARVALEAVKGVRTVLEFATAYEVHLLPAGVCMQTARGNDNPSLEEVASGRRSRYFRARWQGGCDGRDYRRHGPCSACQDRRTGRRQRFFGHESLSRGPGNEAQNDRAKPSQAGGRAIFRGALT